MYICVYIYISIYVHMCVYIYICVYIVFKNRKIYILFCDCSILQPTVGLRHFRLESIGPPVEKGLTEIDTKMGRVSVRLTLWSVNL